MDEEIERLVVSVRADTAGFARDVGAMRRDIEDGLGGGAERAGRLIEGALGRALRTGKVEFEDLKRVALSVMEAIAQAAISNAAGGGGGGGGGLGSLVTALAGAVLGMPGRATGGPVTAGRGYLVGERGPELFVPERAGRIETAGAPAARDVRVAITVNAGQAGAPEALARSGRQIARAVRAALEVGER